MSAGLFHQPRDQRGAPQNGFIADALMRLRALVCRVVHCRGRRPLAPHGVAPSGTAPLADAAQRMQDRPGGYSMLVFELRDLPELECVFGTRAAQEAVGSLTRHLTKLAGRNGAALRTGPTLFTVLLPIANPEYALAAARAALGSPCWIELQVRGHDIVLLPELALQTMGAGDEAVPAYEALCHRLEAAHARPQRRPGTRQHVVQRQPQAAAPAVQASAPRPAQRPLIVKRPEPFYPRLPATIPVPLGMR